MKNLVVGVAHVVDWVGPEEVAVVVEDTKAAPGRAIGSLFGVLEKVVVVEVDVVSLTSGKRFVGAIRC